MNKCEICCPVSGGDGDSGTSVRQLSFDQSLVISLRYYDQSDGSFDLNPRIKNWALEKFNKI